MAKRATKRTPRNQRNTAMPMPGSRADQRKYMAEEDLHTLRRAEEIKGSRMRMSAARQMAKKEMMTLRKIGGRS